MRNLKQRAASWTSAWAMLSVAACGAATDMSVAGSDDHSFLVEGGEIAANDSAVDSSSVLFRLRAEGVGEVVLIDEDPESAEASIGLLTMSGDADYEPIPLQHEDGSEVTPLDIIATLAPERLAEVPARILEHHELLSASTLPRAFERAPQLKSTLGVTQGSCSERAWTSYFDADASALGGVGTPTHVLNHTTSLPSWQAHGYVAAYNRIVVGACFAAQFDGNDNLTVRVERRAGPAYSWGTVSGTSQTLNTSLNGGFRRYIYRSSSFACSSYQRRITVLGLPPGGIHPADLFHMSGAWGGIDGCNLQRSL